MTGFPQAVADLTRKLHKTDTALREACEIGEVTILENLEDLPFLEVHLYSTDGMRKDAADPNLRMWVKETMLEFSCAAIKNVEVILNYLTSNERKSYFMNQYRLPDQKEHFLLKSCEKIIEEIEAATIRMLVTSTDEED